MFGELYQDENLEEFFSSSGINWKINVVDARAIVALKL